MDFPVSYFPFILSRLLAARLLNRNMPTQHISTLLGATHCVHLATVLRHVECCWLKYDHFQTCANNTQQVATHRNTVAKRTQHVAPNPKHLLERAKQTQLYKALFFDNENFQLSPSLSINLTKMKNKDYYCFFVKKSTPLVTALSKWERDLSSNDIHWKNYFKQIKFMCKENKLKEFYFKLVHRILVSKEELHLFGVSNNSNCTYCGQPDSISHTFIECHHSKKLFQSVLQHFNEENVTSFTQSDEELLFGKSLNTIGQLQRSPLLKKLNYCMLLAKYYLYNQKLNQIEPELNEFKNRRNLKYRVEKLV